VQTVESVLAQTWRDLEVIVVDDGSTDGTADILACEFGGRIRLERLPRNQGRSSARNLGWTLARGEFVAFLDSDDLWLPEKLARQMPQFESDNVVLSHTWVGKIDTDGNPLPQETAELIREFERAGERGYDYGGITQTWCRLYTSAAVMRSDLLRRMGGFDQRLSVWEDYDVLWKAALAGEVATLPEVLVLHRTHPGNTPTIWNEDAEPWMTVMRKHLAETEALPDTPELHRGRRNLMVNMALGEFWRRNLPESRRWMWRAMRHDPDLLRHPRSTVWGAPLLHACMPHFLADRMVRRYWVDNYETDSSTVHNPAAPAQEVTLVVDDAPSDATGELLSRLEDEGHRCVLFVIGENVEGREEVLVDAVRRGFALGNHSFLHPHFSRIDLPEARASIEKTDALIDIIYRAAGVRRPGKWFRFPYLDTGRGWCVRQRFPFIAGGRKHHRALQNLLRDLDFERPDSIRERIPDYELDRVDWPTTLCTWDWSLPPDDNMRGMLREAVPGDIIEFHDKPDTIGRYGRMIVEQLSNLKLRATVPQPGRAAAL
jgi:glycosyltransferase involved in cell wall biosynthesis/peptidoglycan/xylan/chitin deacetylase (PgdA/CDA1 family)